MKYVHAIINSPITNPFIDLINQNFNPKDHNFFVIRGLNMGVSKVTEAQNVLIISNIKNIHNGFRLFWNILISKKVFIHGLFTPYLVTILFLQPWVLKKCSWVIWGGDLYSHTEEKLTIKSKIIEFMLSSVIRNMGSIVTSIKGDYELAKIWYNAKGQRINTCYPYYPSGLRTEKIDKILSKVEQGNIKHSNSINVLIGNSAFDTNKHFEIISLLEKFRNENIVIYALLSYGDKIYAEKVRERGKSIFGDKFICVTEYMPYEEFVLFFNKMSIIIFNHERQQGKGNLFLALYLRKKVYMNNKSTLWDYFIEDLKLVVDKTIKIKDESFPEFSTVDNLIVDENRHIIHNVLQEDRIIKQWSELFC